MSLAKSNSPTPGPCIEITPTPNEYKQLCLDLEKLRRLGALSNTEAILAAVRSAAINGKIDGQPKKAGRRSNAPGTATGA